MATVNKTRRIDLLDAPPCHTCSKPSVWSPPCSHEKHGPRRRLTEGVRKMDIRGGSIHTIVAVQIDKVSQWRSCIRNATHQVGVPAFGQLAAW